MVKKKLDSVNIEKSLKIRQKVGNFDLHPPLNGIPN